MRIPRLCVSPDISEAAPSFITTWAKTSTLAGTAPVFGIFVIGGPSPPKLGHTYPRRPSLGGWPSTSQTAAQSWHHHSRRVSTGGRAWTPQRGLVHWTEPEAPCRPAHTHPRCGAIRGRTSELHLACKDLSRVAAHSWEHINRFRARGAQPATGPHCLSRAVGWCCGESEDPPPVTEHILSVPSRPLQQHCAFPL